MGKRGPLPKSAGQAMGHRQPAQIVRLVPGARRNLPKAPPGLLPGTRKAWRDYWASSKSQLVTPDTMPVLIRLFEMRDDLARERMAYRESRLVKGSVGQIRLNPLADNIMRLEAAVARLEVEFGMTPLAAMRLGIAFGEASRSLEELNRQFSDPHRGRTAQTEDPLAGLLKPAADEGRTEAPEPGT